MRSTVLAVVVLSFTPWARADEPAKPPQDFLSVVRTCFPTWDSDQNGILTTTEIDVVVADANVRGAEAAAIATLKRTTRSSRYKLSQLTLSEIEELKAAAPGKDRPDLVGMYGNSYERIEQLNRELFVSGKPRLDTIHQGKLGNCYCLAPLGAVLFMAPERVNRMFEPAQDGSYCVRFGDRVVQVSVPTDAELAQTASNERDGIWINLYEKAIGEARNVAKPVEQRSSSPIDAMARGGSAGTMLSFITGHKIQRFSFVFAKQESLAQEQRLAILSRLRMFLCEAVEQRKPMTCGTLKTTTPGITPNHAYAVLGYDRATDWVQLWNPHGGQFLPKGTPGREHGYMMRDGLFGVPLEEFVHQFSGMARETELAAGDKPELPKLP
jgi:calpain family cysteine protease